jgi:hypothetical protein
MDKFDYIGLDFEMRRATHQPRYLREPALVPTSCTEFK